MANDEKRKRPHAVEAGKATRFKKGNTAQADGGVKPWSYRNEFRYLAAQEIDITQLDKELKRLSSGRNNKATMARIVCARALEKLIKKMEAPLLNVVIENTEGKLTQEIIIPSTRKAPTKFLTEAEAAAAYMEFIKT